MLVYSMVLLGSGETFKSWAYWATFGVTEDIALKGIKVVLIQP
jgi:hypothetical protein